MPTRKAARRAPICGRSRSCRSPTGSVSGSNWPCAIPLNPTGEPARYLYTLRTTLTVSLSDLGIQSQGTATLGRLDVYANSVLFDNRTGAALLTNSLHAQNSFALNPNQYSTVVGEHDAGIRTIAELNNEIVRRLTLFMERRAAQNPPKTG